MKKTLLILGGIALVFALYLISGYNGLVGLDEGVKEKWSQVENQYQRRIDLVPNLVNTVKGAAAHERETLEAVTNARASATQMNVDLQSAEEMAEFQAKQTGLSSALGRLLAISENYPVLQANQNFLGLMTQLEGTENRISTERKRYNEAVRDFNTKVRTFPTNFTAGIFGFEKYVPFTAEEGSDTAPDVEF